MLRCHNLQCLIAASNAKVILIITRVLAENSAETTICRSSRRVEQLLAEHDYRLVVIDDPRVLQGIERPLGPERATRRQPTVLRIARQMDLYMQGAELDGAFVVTYPLKLAKTRKCIATIISRLAGSTPWPENVR